MDTVIFHKALVAVDGSEQAQRAVEMAIKLAQSGVVEQVVLYHVYDNSPVDVTKLHNLERLDAIRADSQALLTGYAQQFLDVGLQPKLKRAGGDPATLIVDLVENDGEFDLVIMGNRRLNQFQKLVLGSVSDRVTRLVEVPVLTIK
jgi:nucleotide-binding universal stress UspA family protein